MDESPPTHPDVLVIGAGAAGLMAARELSKSHHVIVLEARERVGGRMQTIRPTGQILPVELGPEFVHGEAEETFGLLKQAGIAAYDIADRHWDANGHAPREKPEFWEEVEKLLSRLKRVKKDCSFEEFLAKHGKGFSSEARRLATMYVEGFNAADKSRISAHSIRRAEEEASGDDRQFRLLGGYDQLAGALQAGIREPSRIEFFSIVERVEWKRGEVIVTARQNDQTLTYRAPRVVITLPLGVLQSSNTVSKVIFDPPLPVQSLIDEKLVMGPVTRVIFEFDRPWWEDFGFDEVSFVHSKEAPIPTWWTTLPIRTSRLSGWAGGPAAERIGHDEQAIVSSGIESLSKIFRKKPAFIRERLREHWICDWQLDPFSLGAYSYAAVGGANVPDKLARPIEDTLFFAGEHTHGVFLGTVAGALESGRRVAKQIARLSPSPSGRGQG